VVPRSIPIIPIALPTPWTSVGPVHVYLVREDPITLIDTGLDTPESQAALVAGLRAHGIALTDIKRVLITHAHYDHYGFAGRIQDASGAEVFAHRDEEGKLDGPDWWLEARRRTLVDCGVSAEIQAVLAHSLEASRHMISPLQEWRSLTPARHFESESGLLEAVHLPGHALGHTGYWDSMGQVLIGGDHLLDSVTPNPIMEAVGPGHPAAVPHAPYRALTLGQFLDSLERVSAMPLTRVLAGHGPEILDHVGLANYYRTVHERRLDSLQARLVVPISAWDLTRLVYPKVKNLELFLALSEVLAHLDLLVVRGRAHIVSGGLFQSDLQNKLDTE